MYETNCTDCRRAFIAGEFRWLIFSAGERAVLCATCVETMRETYLGLRRMESSARDSDRPCMDCGSPAVTHRLPDGSGLCDPCARKSVDREFVDELADYAHEVRAHEVRAHEVRAKDAQAQDKRAAAARVESLTDERRAEEMRHQTRALQIARRMARPGCGLEEKGMAYDTLRPQLNAELVACGLWPLVAAHDALIVMLSHALILQAQQSPTATNAPGADGRAGH